MKRAKYTVLEASHLTRDRINIQLLHNPDTFNYTIYINNSRIINLHGVICITDRFSKNKTILIPESHPWYNAWMLLHYDAIYYELIDRWYEKLEVPKDFKEFIR